MGDKVFSLQDQNSNSLLHYASVDGDFENKDKTHALKMDYVKYLLDNKIVDKDLVDGEGYKAYDLFLEYHSIQHEQLYNDEIRSAINFWRINYDDMGPSTNQEEENLFTSLLQYQNALSAFQSREIATTPELLGSYDG